MPNLSSPPTRIQDVSSSYWKTWFSLLHSKINELESTIESLDGSSSSSTDIPSGGIKGQILSRSSGGGLEWINAPIGIPAGGIAGAALYKQSNVDYDVDWGAPVLSIEFTVLTSDLLLTTNNPTIELILNVDGTTDSLTLTENASTITTI